MRNYLLLCLLLGYSNHITAGKKLNILFIGNSYTHVNSMPQIVADIATSMGDTLVWDMSAPGGASFYDHCTDATTLAKIQAGNWDYVVLQEQSQTPALPDVLVPGMFTQARQLDSLINVYSPCSETIFYMTWGRKNGDASNCSFFTVQYNWPWYCTYAGMDSVIRLRYRMMADSNAAAVSPAGAVWHYVRTHYPSIELYNADESHPSEAGSYAVACSFYTALFKKDPALINYSYTLGSTVAADIRLAAKKVVYDSMSYWHIGQHRTEAVFRYIQTANTISFTNTSLNAVNYQWYFGDGQSAMATSPTHIYNQPGNYTIMLIASNNTGCSDTTYGLVSINAASIHPLDADGRPYTISTNAHRGSFTIDMPDQSAEVVVLNNCGQAVLRQKMCNSLLVDLEDHPTGIYFVCILNVHGTWYSKLIVH